MNETKRIYIQKTDSGRFGILDNLLGNCRVEPYVLAGECSPAPDLAQMDAEIDVYGTKVHCTLIVAVDWDNRTIELKDFVAVDAENYFVVPPADD